jgi:putative nucleotidyltransferase with HDIG domain
MIRIIFVDDEPRILRGLKRMLDSMRRQWDMHFVSSGKEVLDVLSQEHFDVIVSDMRMPGMTGVELLEKVRELYPHMVRIALSGQSSKDSVLRSVGPIHQYLPKPCNEEELKSTITRTCALQSILKIDKIRGVISELESLPSLPAFYNQLMKELKSPEPSVKRIGDIISNDIGMSAKILQLVNSAFFGLRHHISSPTRAVTVLGLDTVKSLALTIQVFSQFETADVMGFSLTRLWEHSFAVSALAKHIATSMHAAEPIVDHSLMGGLLHDVGKLILASKLPKDYEAAAAMAHESSMPICEAETKVIGATHAEIGAYLLGLWGFAEPMIHAVAFHHRPMDSHTTGFSALLAVHVANALAKTANSESTERDNALDMEYLSAQGLSDKLADWQALAHIEISEEVVQ